MPAPEVSATLQMRHEKEDTMTQVLIAYASKYGSVEEVARYIAAILRDEGAACDVVAARDAVDLEGYDLDRPRRGALHGTAAP